MKVLLGYDGSPCADEALDDLLWAGLPAEVSAEVLTVADVLLPRSARADEAADPAMPAGVAQSRAAAYAAVEEAGAIAERGAARLRERFPDWTVTSHGVADSPAWALVKRADAWPADLVVVGATGLGAWERVRLGSVSSTVAAEAHCGVRVFRRDRTRAQGQGPVDRTAPLRIVVAVDGSRRAEAAVAAVAARDWPAGSAARVVTIVDGRLGGALAGGLDVARRWAEEVGIDLDENHAWVRRMVDDSTERLHERGLAANAVVREGDAKRILLEELEEWSADVLFLGSRGHSRVERLVLGSLSSAMVRHAPCAVEIVR